MKGNDENNGRYTTWKWLSGILILAVFALIGFFIGGNISESKVDAKEMRIKLEQTCDRVTVLETNYQHIKTYMEKSDQFQQRMEKILSRLEQKQTLK